MRQAAGAWLAVALFAVFTVWLILGATARLIDRELDLFTPQTAPGAEPVIANLEQP